MDNRETVAQRFNAIVKDGKAFAIINKGTHGSSVSDGAMRFSLVRNAAYCAHPLGDDRPLLRPGRYIRRIDMGETSFDFRITAANVGELERLAWEFNNAPLAINIFPVQAEEAAPKLNVTVSDKDVVLITMKKCCGDDTYALRLFSNAPESKTATVKVGGASIDLTFGKHEVKTLEYDGKSLTESALMLI